MPRQRFWGLRLSDVLFAGKRGRGVAELKGRGLLVAGTLALAPRLARADTFPTKPVRIIVPYPPGGGTDIVVRLVAPRLGERWKQTVIVENKAGASGIVGSEVVAHAA